MRLACTACFASFVSTSILRCSECGEWLEVDGLRFGARSSDATWPPSQADGLEVRWDAFLPQQVCHAPTLGEGSNPLLRSRSLEQELGGRRGYLAQGGQDPTRS